MRHETVVTEVPAKELEKILKARHKQRWGEKHPELPPMPAGLGIEQPEYQEPEEYPEDGWKEMLEGLGDKGYNATCKCGWEANNPLPSKEAAEENAEAHITSIYGEG